jgi:hypothetical protein
MLVCGAVIARVVVKRWLYTEVTAWELHDIPNHLQWRWGAGALAAVGFPRLMASRGRKVRQVCWRGCFGQGRANAPASCELVRL